MTAPSFFRILAPGFSNSFAGAASFNGVGALAPSSAFVVALPAGLSCAFTRCRLLSCDMRFAPFMSI
jgi:hypothetical protein